MSDKLCNIAFCFIIGLTISTTMRLLFIIFLSIPFSLFAQFETPYQSTYTITSESEPLWITEMYKTDSDPGKVIGLYDEYYKTNTFIKNSHTQYYKRWLRSISREVQSSPSLDRKYKETQNQISTRTESWTTIGPIDWDHDAAARSYAPGAAHVYTIEQSEANNDVVYAGTANAGIWKTTDRGTNWTPLTYNINTGTTTAIEINHENDDIVYAELFSSIYKSIDGGNIWLPTGDASFQGTALNVTDIRMDPTDTNKLYAATNEGLYRTTDGGVTWTEPLNGDILEIEIHPTDHDTIYAVLKSSDETEFYRSLDNGLTFDLVGTEWPQPDVAAGEEQKRTEIAVSADMPDRVVALATGSANGGSGLYGIYVSDDNGTNWTFKCCGPQPAGPPSEDNMNLMAWSDQGTDDGGQYYYDLALDISPTNGDSIFVGGVNMWVSGDGGDTFVCPAKWSHPYKPNYVHADIHDIKYNTFSGDLWVLGDGGIFYSNDNGDNFTRKIYGIAGTDFWGFGQGFWHGDVMLGGAYHNGTMLKEEEVYDNGWICTDGGDGVRGFVNPGIDRQAYSDYNIKTLNSDRTVSPSTRGFSNKPNGTYTTGRSSDLLFHPEQYTAWYSGSGTKLYFTEDNGYTFEERYEFNEDVSSMDISWSNPDYIYVSTFPSWWGEKKIYKSTDGGNTFTDITPSNTVMPDRRWIPFDIEVNAEDPEKIYIGRTSMYGDGAYEWGVYTSDDGGTTWSNITGSLNGEAITNIKHQKGTDGGLWIGTRLGVYYKNNTMADWELFVNDLPMRTHSVRVVPYYRKEKIRNATNRSVWESDLYENSKPLAQISVDRKLVCTNNDTLNFVDHSIVSDNDVSWLWTFDGGTPATSTERTVQVAYADAGQYDVTLTVTDTYGTSTKTWEKIISADNYCKLEDKPLMALECIEVNDHVNVPSLDITTNNFSVTAWIKPNGIQDEYTGIFFNDDDSAGLNFRESNNTLAYHWPGGSWSWDSGLEVPSDVWSHVALVAEPSGVTVYLNGVGVKHNDAINTATFGTGKIGSYKGWDSRNYRGQIDEVCIWNKSLTQEEIREYRHLVKNPTLDTDILAYYQFNRSDPAITDFANGRDATLAGAATLVTSDGPFGAGESERVTVVELGTYDFLDGDIDIEFVSGIVPDGELVVTHLRVDPDIVPKVNKENIDAGYWILNNYGSNQNLNTYLINSFKNTGTISQAMLDDNFPVSIYNRDQNAHTDIWELLIDNPDLDKQTGKNGIIEYTNDMRHSRIDYQYLILRDSMPTGIADIRMSTPDANNTSPKGGSSMALHIDAVEQGLKLPVMTTLQIENIKSPSAGSVILNSTDKYIYLYNGAIWKALSGNSFLAVPTGTVTNNTAGFSFGGSPTGSSAYALPDNAGVLLLNSFTDASVIDIDYPQVGMMIYNNDDASINYYDGHQWKLIITTDIEITAATGAADYVEGVIAGEGPKDPNAALQIISADKVISIPQMNATSVVNPVQGVIIYDIFKEALVYYNGVNWNTLN